MRKELPEPECKLGYTREQIREMFGTGDRLAAFWSFMYGQTLGVCTGKKYNLVEDEYLPTGCGPHGSVVYSHDVERFIRGLPPLD